MKIVITVKDTDNVIGLKEDIAMRLEGVTDIVRIDTADVVPKSEVDKDIKALTKEIAKQKAMLLDAIDTFRNLLCIESFVDYEDTRKHYVVNLDDVDRIHDELKKKYTED